MAHYKDKVRLFLETPNSHASGDMQGFITHELVRPSKQWVNAIVAGSREKEFVKLRTEHFVLLPDTNGPRRVCKYVNAERPWNKTDDKDSEENEGNDNDKHEKCSDYPKEKEWTTYSRRGTCNTLSVCPKQTTWNTYQRNAWTPCNSNGFWNAYHPSESSWSSFYKPRRPWYFGTAPASCWAYKSLQCHSRRFNWLAIMSDPDLRSIRDLRGEHIELLEMMRDQCMEAIQKEYDVTVNDVMVFANYPPSVYRLHFHFCMPFFHPGPFDAFRMHSLSAIINNLRIHPLYYKLSSFQIPIHPGSELFRAMHSAKIEEVEEITE